MVAEGSFREDLYYRISVVPILIPPLRERTEDLLLLARYYVEEFNRKFKKKVTGFAEDAERILTAYPWPGNVRELKNIIERIMILHNDGFQITYENLPAEMRITTNQEKLRLQIDNILPHLSPKELILHGSWKESPTISRGRLSRIPWPRAEETRPRRQGAWGFPDSSSFGNKRK